MSSEVVAAVTAWCAAICTFAILSVLYRENRFYRLFEHIFIGVAVGFGLYATWSRVLEPDWWKPMVTEGRLALSDGEQGGGWQGVTEMHVKEGAGAIRWDLAQTPVLSTTPDQTDWSNVQYLRFWLYSENAAGAQVHLVLQSGKGEEESEGRSASDALNALMRDSWVAELPIRFQGWQQILLHRSAFRPEGEPDWTEVRRVRFVLTPDTAPPGAALHLDDFRAFSERRRLVREGRIEVQTAARLARWEGQTETTVVANQPAVRWSGATMVTEEVRRTDWATLQYLHVWLYTDEPQEGTVRITLHSEFEDREAERDEQDQYPLKQGSFQASLPLQFRGWQECVLHRSRFVPEGEASWQHIVRLSLSRPEVPSSEAERGLGGRVLPLSVGDVVAYTGRTRWTLAGEMSVSNCDDAGTWSGATANRVQEKEGALKWLPGKTPEIVLKEEALPLKDWSPYHYLRLWAGLPEGTRLPITVRVHTEKQEEVKEEPPGQEQWTKIGTFSAEITLDQREWTPFQLFLSQFEGQGEPDWEGVQRVTLSIGEGEIPPETTVYMDDLSLYSGRKWYWALALVAGLMYYTIYSKRYAWFNRLIIGVMMGLSAGIAFKGFVTEIFPQVSSSFKPLWGGDLSPLQIFNNFVFIVTLLCVLMYFFFSFEHKHTAVRGSARMGRWLLMICFGVIFGNTVMGRMSLFIDRLMFLINDWWPHVIGRN